MDFSIRSAPAGRRLLKQFVERPGQVAAVCPRNKPPAVSTMFQPVERRIRHRKIARRIQRAGSLEEGLRYYVGAANLAEDTGYAARVLAEHDLLKAVASGRTVPATTTTTVRPLREAASSPSGESDQVALLR